MMAQPVETKPRIKPLTCAWWVRKAELQFDRLAEILTEGMYGDMEDRERLSDFVKKQLGLLRDSYRRVETHCGLNLEIAERFLKDAEDYISSGNNYINWFNAKESLLVSHVDLVLTLRGGVEEERGEL
jgi:hypothetical protein